MTIASLLSKLNGRTPRFVTVKGQVIGSTGVVKVGGDYVHADHGPVTRMIKHTFHGGQDEMTAVAEPSDDVETWWTFDPSSLDTERANMAKSFPEFREIENDGRLAWTGVIDTGRGKFTIVVTHRRDHGLPSIDVISPKILGRTAGKKFVKPPHLYLSGKICVAAKSDWDSSTNHAATIVAWAAHWLGAYTEWRMNLRWPVTGLDFDVE